VNGGLRKLGTALLSSPLQQLDLHKTTHVWMEISATKLDEGDTSGLSCWHQVGPTSHGPKIEEQDA